jgi:hypothetical protein
VLSGVSPKLRGLEWSSAGLLPIRRQQSSEIVLSDPSVSRRHAEVMSTHRGWVIRDRVEAKLSPNLGTPRSSALAADPLVAQSLCGSTADFVLPAVAGYGLAP